MTARRLVRISRAPSLPPFLGLRAFSLEALLRRLRAEAAGLEWVVSDLTLGAWQSHQVAADFRAQVGRPAAGEGGAVPEPPNRPAYGETASQWIDVEAAGDTAILTALARARDLLTRLREGPPRVFVVLLPRPGFAWEAENVHFVQFLAHGLAGQPSRLLLVETALEPTPLPAGWQADWSEEPASGAPACGALLRLVPGLVAPETATAVRPFDKGAVVPSWPLPDGSLLIAPECRPPGGRASPLEYDRLALAAAGIDWLRAYAQYHGNNFHVQSMFLFEEGRTCMAAGGYGIALRLIERAIPCAATPVLKAFLQMHAQGWRIGLQMYREVADGPEPSPSLPASLQGALALLKGWGLAMANEAARAAPLLTRARDQLRAHYGDGVEMLYASNIYALSRFRLGDVEGALAIEEQIERETDERAASTGARDWALEYVNRINLARVQRKRGDFEASERYYRRAFATTLGARSESDFIYTNVCEAVLHDKRQRPREAFLGWLRAALHWLACAVPEALVWRSVVAILGRPPAAGENKCEAVSDSLAQALAAAAKTAGLAAGAADGATHEPAFVRSDDLGDEEALGSARAVGAAGWGVLVLPQAVRPTYVGDGHRRLCRLVFALLQQLAPAGALPAAEALAVDDQLGRDVPTTFAEALVTCLRLRVPELAFGEVRLRLDPALRNDLEHSLVIRLGSAVDRVATEDGRTVVTFKRYLSPRECTAEEAGLLAAIGTTPADSLLPLARALERDRVLELHLPLETCARWTATGQEKIRQAT
ncbi:MAG TPA: tetratricopeptide repeat protein [Gemmataceae bacterium]|nr:tetratricopeptide repeat protein [Gemmataceae bacterium]